MILTLYGPSNATLGNDSIHTYTINDNDGTPTVSFSSTSSSDSEAVSSVSVDIEIPFASESDIEVDYVITGTATGSGVDFNLANGTVTIIAGAKTGTITIVEIIDDTLNESDETGALSLSVMV